jgi:hypothetical protein
MTTALFHLQAKDHFRMVLIKPSLCLEILPGNGLPQLLIAKHTLYQCFPPEDLSDFTDLSSSGAPTLHENVQEREKIYRNFLRSFSNSKKKARYQDLILLIWELLRVQPKVY